jgi:hypothetical protein
MIVFVKCDDNAAEADTPTGGSISSDVAASLEMKANSVKETLSISSPSIHPTHEPADSRSLLKTDLFCLFEQNAYLDRTQKERLFQVLVKYLGYMTIRPGRCSNISFK